MANERSFIIEAAVKCGDYGSKGRQYCRFKRFEREPVRFIVDEDGKIIWESICLARRRSQVRKGC